MAGANGFYSPPSPLKVCQGPAYTIHHCSVSRQALTLLPHQSLHAYWLYRVYACYSFIEGFLMCLENCLMIGIMMPFGVSCLSTLSPTNTEKKTDRAHAKRKNSSLPWMFASTSPAIQSRPVLLTSISITPHLQVCHRGDVRHHVSPAEQPFHAPA